MRGRTSSKRSESYFGRLRVQPWEYRMPEVHIAWGEHIYFTLQSSSVCEMTFSFIKNKSVCILLCLYS